jgi:hypothetical protein
MGSAGRTCAVCGRTILAGEQVHGYLAEAGPRAVCELCVARAERLGWRTEGEGRQDAGGGAGPAKRRRGRGGFLRRRPPEEAAPAPSAAANGPDPAAPGRRPEGPAPDLFQLSPFERAVTRFNVSEAGRTVVGLRRTLGAPWVSVGAAAGAPTEMRITVAWELSWYQWGVDLGDELRPVFQIDKGQEIAQLDAAARQWNAATDEEGRVVLFAPAGAGTATR